MAVTVYPVILAGGSGTRLWPISTPSRPKHLLEMVGSGTMLEQTIDRVSHPGLFGCPTIVSAAAQGNEVAKLAPEARLLLEPIPRGSAAAVALAAWSADPSDVLLVLPSDHIVTDPAPLYEAIVRALPAAEAGNLITFGIQPDHPETGFGYIIGGDEIGAGVLKAQSFVEKPARKTAEQLVSTGKAFWNSGMFMFKAGAMLMELERHAPEIHSATKGATEGAVRDGNQVTPDRGTLEGCPSTSIDYAVMEHSDRIAVVPVQLGWSDVGSWASVFDLAPKDSADNVVDNRSAAIDSHGCLIRSAGPRIVTVGVEDLIVIATPDYVLIVPRAEAQRVREAAELMKGK
jgi:mannose-1-phosphate guanylyltransferase